MQFVCELDKYLTVRKRLFSQKGKKEKSANKRIPNK